MKPIERIKQQIFHLKGRKSFSYLAIVKYLMSQGYDVINFGIGQPDVDTPKPIVEEAKKALDKGFTKYTEVQGILELREAIANYLSEKYGENIKPSEIIVTPGALSAIFLAYLSYIESGDEVVIIEPSYPPYTELTTLFNAYPVYVPLIWRGVDKGFELDTNALDNRISSKTKMIVLNNPHNPTGAVIPPRHIEYVLDIAKKHNIIILVDEIYNEFVFNDTIFKSIISFDNWRDYVIYVNGFSKTFSMTGWRLGYLVAREDLATKLANIAVNIWSCTTSFVQKAAVVALKDNEVWNYVEETIDLFKKRRDFMVTKLREIRGIEVWSSSGTFYLFPYVGRLLEKIGIDVDLFAEELLNKKHVAVLPGTGFPDKAGKDFIRLSFALDINSIARGIERIKQYIEELEQKQT